jgi:putative ABC transport system permease protein
MWSRLIETWYRVTASFRRRRLERDLDDEVAFHVAMRQASYAENGASTIAARREAHRRFGNVTALKEQMRNMWTFPSFENIRQDVRYAVRSLRRQPGFAAVAVLVLAAVTGLNTSLFTVFTALTLHAPTGVADPSRVVSLYPAVPASEPPLFSLAEYRFLTEHAKSLDLAAVSDAGTLRLGIDGANGTTGALLVSGNFFDVLGIATERGRAFGAGEDRPDAPDAVAVLGAALWESRFGGDPTIVGRTILINNVSFTIVGIAPRDFIGLEPAVMGRPGLFIPIASFTLLRPELSSSLGAATVVGRLAPGATRGQVRAEVDLLLRRFHAQAGTDARGVIVAGTAFLSHPGRSVILVLLGLISIALMLVWLLACANVGNLQLARAAARAHEIGIRLSLGASRGRIVRQLLVEGFVLALAAGARGVGVAYAFPPLLLWFVGDVTALDAVNFSLAPDVVVLAYAVLLAGGSSIAFGLAPALHVTRSDVAAALKDREAPPHARFPLRGVLLGVQVAVSVIVLVGAGLLVRRVQRQASFDPGFPVNDVSVVTFVPTGELYVNAARTNAFVTALSDALRQMPIDAFGFATSQPFGFGGTPTVFRLPGESPAQARPITYVNVSPGYLNVLRVPIIAGRDFERTDAARNVALINESMARQYWPNDNPIGRTFFVGRSENREIVGVVRNISNGLEEVYPMFYRPLGASTSGGGVEMSAGRRVVTTEGGPIPQLFVRTRGTAASDAIAATVARIDPSLRVQTKPLAASLEERRKGFRVGPILAGLLGVFALVLATVGMFGVFAYAVRQRTREIGIRMALGAQPADVVRLILAGHSRAVGVGLFVGLLGAIAASQIMRSFTYGLSPFDPVTYLGVAALLASAGIAASYVPARRATRINPIEALRCD